MSDQTSTNQRLGWSNNGFLEQGDGHVAKIINYDSVAEYISKKKLYGYTIQEITQINYMIEQ